MIKTITPTIVPEIKQELAYEVLWNKFTSFVVFGGGAGGGKTWLGSEWLITNCYNYPGSRWFIGRKELKSLLSTSYLTFRKVCRHHQIPDSDWKLNQQYNYIEFVDGRAKGSRIDLLDLSYKPSDPLYERFGSQEFTGGWIDEAGEIDFLCFEVLKIRIGRHLNKEYGLFPAKMLLTCNPTQNWLYRIFYKPWKRGILPDDYAFIQSLYGDNSYTRDEYGKQLATLQDPVMRARLKEGLWEYDADSLAVMSFDAIVDMFLNEVVFDPTNYATVDVARFGGDKIVFNAWRGLDMYRVETREKQGLNQTVEHLRDFLSDERIPYERTTIDEDGVGGGVVDGMMGVHGFMGGRSPILKPDTDVEEMESKYANIPAQYLKKQNYRNLRTQCYMLLANKINNHQIRISAPLSEMDKEHLIEELQQIKRVDTVPDAPLQIVGKELIKESLGRSPDLADTLMMRMYFDLIKTEPPKGVYNAPNEKYLRERGISTPYGGIEGYSGLGMFGL